MFAVTVTFTIKPEFTDAFSSLISQNAATSVEVESGCQLFDICQDPSNPNVFFLYEIYDDAAGFDLHLASDHFKDFSRACEHMVATKEIATFQKIRAARA